jgi:putative alpha-1,2-mannosidase
VPPPPPVPASRDNISFDGGNIEGRGAVEDWINIGWITRNHSRCISRAVEYAQNDFAIYQVARGLGKTADAAKYRNRSMQWENMWNANFSSDLPPNIGNFKGFLTPRNADGTFNLTGVTGLKVFNATDCGECEWNSDTYEAVPYEYSFAVPHDVANLIEKVCPFHCPNSSSLTDVWNRWEGLIHS